MQQVGGCRRDSEAQLCQTGQVPLSQTRLRRACSRGVCGGSIAEHAKKQAGTAGQWNPTLLRTRKTKRTKTTQFNSVFFPETALPAVLSYVSATPPPPPVSNLTWDGPPYP